MRRTTTASSLHVARHWLPLLLATLLPLLALPRVARASAAIDTIAAWSGSTSIAPFGVPSIATFGQTVTPPDATNVVLQDFSFEMQLPTTIAFQGEVYAWDTVNNRALGSAIWEGAAQSTTSGSAFQQITFTTGGVTLNAGQEYVLFASTSKLQSGHSGVGSWGFVSPATYTGGSFVFLDNGADSSQWTTTSWGVLSIGDTAFHADFTPAAVTTTTALSSSLNPSFPGQSVTFTATVTCTGFTPAGSVTFTIGSVTEPPVALTTVSGQQQAAFTTSTLTTGFYTVTAAYSGDSNCAASTSAPLTQVVNLLGAAVLLSSSQNPSVVGQSVTITATVTCLGFTPTGTVTFSVDGTPQPPVTIATVSGQQQAAITLSGLAIGNHTINAQYGGAGFCPLANAFPLTQQVNAAGAGTTLTSSQNPSTAGQAVTFTATVSCPGFTPSGTVTFSIDGTPQTPVALGPVNGQQQAAFSTSGLGVGSHSIGASYAGDADCAPSSAAPLTQTVLAAAAASTTVTLSAQPASALPGQPVTLTAVVASSDGTLPTGTVTVVLDGLVAGSAPLSGGVAGLTTGPLGPGPHTAQAFYSGDASHSAAVSAPLLLAPAGATVILTGATLTFAVQGCGSISPPSEQGAHQFGDTMLLTAVPCPGSTFTGWLSGPCAGSTVNPCAVAMPPTNLTVTAGFSP